MATWATVSEVAEITGATVTEGQLGLANGVIELAAGRTSDTAHIPARDLRWLKRAVAYQAAWMLAQPDFFTRLDLDSSVQDGVHAKYAAKALTLAPLAKAALRKLTWKGNRSVFTESTLSGSRGPFFLGVEGVVSIFDYQWERWKQET